MIVSIHEKTCIEPTLKDLQVCAWCGGECFAQFHNRRDEIFCSKNHRNSSNRALNRLLGRDNK